MRLGGLQGFGPMRQPSNKPSSMAEFYKNQMKSKMLARLNTMQRKSSGVTDNDDLLDINSGTHEIDIKDEGASTPHDVGKKQGPDKIAIDADTQHDVLVEMVDLEFYERRKFGMTSTGFGKAVDQMSGSDVKSELSDTLNLGNQTGDQSAMNKTGFSQALLSGNVPPTSQ